MMIVSSDLLAKMLGGDIQTIKKIRTATATPYRNTPPGTDGHLSLKIVRRPRIKHALGKSPGDFQRDYKSVEYQLR